MKRYDDAVILRRLDATTVSSARHVLCDFDGTITAEDVTDGLLMRFADPRWETIEADWQAGRIGSRACLAAQIALLEVDKSALDAYLDQVDIDPHFRAFAAFCTAQALHLEIISDGLDYALARILARHGLAHLPRTANRLVFLPGQRYRVDFPYRDAGCAAASGVCKCQVVQPHRDQWRLLIGDGTSDFCLAGAVDQVYARGKLLDHCRRLRIAHQPCTDFHQATLLLERELRQAHTPTLTLKEAALHG
jgi:2,3-diketo-5-methylthio-1-phosphopentane phosphatase